MSFIALAFARAGTEEGVSERDTSPEGPSANITRNAAVGSSTPSRGLSTARQPAGQSVKADADTSDSDRPLPPGELSPLHRILQDRSSSPVNFTTSAAFFTGEVRLFTGELHRLPALPGDHQQLLGNTCTAHRILPPLTYPFNADRRRCAFGSPAMRFNEWNSVDSCSRKSASMWLCGFSRHSTYATSMKSCAT
jgi:hypothetical protein